MARRKQTTTDLLIAFSFSNVNTSVNALLLSYTDIEFFDYDNGEVRVGSTNKNECDKLAKDLAEVAGITSSIREVIDNYFTVSFNLVAVVKFSVGENISLNVKEVKNFKPKTELPDAAAIQPAIESTCVVILKSAGNPDLKQFSGVSPQVVEPCRTYRDAVALCKAYISVWDLGGGNWTGGDIVHPTKGTIARVSYNGRVWEHAPLQDLKEITNLDQSIL